MVKLEVSIDDQKWPKLKMTLTRTDINGQKHVLQNERQYDGAYSQFENDLHNHLRPMIEQLVKRRLGK
jgi:hypothetical protein